MDYYRAHTNIDRSERDILRLALERERRHRNKSRTKIALTPEETFGVWMARARPEYRWDYAHFVAMQALLDQATAGTAKRIYFQIPIRHGKTEHNTISYACYRLERNPRCRILICSYNQQRAQKFSRDTRRLLRLRGIVNLSPDRDAAGEWETDVGGGVTAVGAGQGVASVNADVILVDDPVGSRDDAESAAKREQIWDWFTNDLLARCEPHTVVIFTMSRWHQDDPAGRLLDRQRDRWTTLDLPAEAEANDPLGRGIGAPLWPELRGRDWLIQMRAELGEYGYASLLLGRPRPREGGMFKWQWWQLLNDVPAVGPMVRYWDLAGTDKERSNDPDWTSGSLVCRMVDQRSALVDVTRFRKSVAARDAELEAICRADLAAYRSRIVWWIETEAGIQGAERTQNIVRRLQACGMAVKTEHPTGSKLSRAEPLASMAEAGNILLCPGAWRDPFRAEAADFPNGLHDDQIDSTAGAVSKLAQRHTAYVSTIYS